MVKAGNNFFSFMITGKKYTKYDISKNTFGEDLNSPAPTTVPLHVLGQGLGSNSNLGEGEDFQPTQSCRKGGTSRELPFISSPPKKNLHQTWPQGAFSQQQQNLNLING